MRSNYVNPLPGVPIVESPFFNEVFYDDSHDPETLRIAQDLNRDGFAIFDFPDDEIGQIADEVRSRLQARYPWEDWRERRRPDLRLQDAWRDDPFVKRLATNKSMVSLLTTLYGRRAFPFQTLNFAVGTQQHFHTDSIHFSSMPERFMCGVWLALEDVCSTQGPLLYYPGSHRWPIYTNEHIGHSYRESGVFGPYEPLWERLVEVHGVKPVQFLPKKGQAAIWAANLLHGGDAHHDRKLTRWSQVTHYYFEDCSYYTPLASDEPSGSVNFREPIDVATDELKQNFYNGQLVPKSFIDQGNLIVSGAGNEALPAGFDAATYLKLNPDVAAAGADPATHYRQFGRREGRRYEASQS